MPKTIATGGNTSAYQLAPGFIEGRERMIRKWKIVEERNCLELKNEGGGLKSQIHKCNNVRIGKP